MKIWKHFRFGWLMRNFEHNWIKHKDELFGSRSIFVICVGNCRHSATKLYGSSIDPTASWIYVRQRSQFNNANENEPEYRNIVEYDFFGCLICAMANVPLGQKRTVYIPIGRKRSVFVFFSSYFFCFSMTLSYSISCRLFHLDSNCLEPATKGKLFFRRLHTATNVLICTYMLWISYGAYRAYFHMIGLYGIFYSPSYVLNILYC